jgi:hypothetical protein
MKDKSKRLPVADQIRKGLEEAILHAKGEITLKTGTTIREVHGTINGGRIGWSAEDVKIIKGNRGLDYTGTIQDTNLVMSFSGRDRNTRKTLSGTVKMRLER